jgi:cell wall-associated NlpC family hydrolase
MMSTDVFVLARAHIGRSIYRRYVEMDEAPRVINCITLVRWLFHKHGVSLPSDYLTWLTLGVSVRQSDIASGDLIFTDGYRGQTVEGIGKIGHVGLATNRKTIIHATSKIGIEEIPLDIFFAKRTFCCARKIL